MLHARVRWHSATVAALLLLTGTVTLAAESSRSPLADPLVDMVEVNDKTPDTDCLECHGVEGFAVPIGEFGESPKRKLYIDKATLHDSVHVKQQCVACHTDINQIPHKPDKLHTVDCIQCHEDLAPQKNELQTQVDITQSMVGLPPEVPEQTKLSREISLYLASIHAQPNKDNPGHPNANCWDCHGKHNIFPMSSKDAPIYRLSTPETCGRCHEEALKQYTNSVHGAPVKRQGNLKPAVCSDCHSAHKIESPKEDSAKLAITKNCGSCHESEVKTYRSTYHGQVTLLGYAHTAKCYDCHDSHNIQKTKNPLSKTNSDNLLETCRECHKQASASFVQFHPHGNTHDYERFPAMWIASKLMIVLLGVVFLFFWGHSLLWFYRERKEQKAKRAALRDTQQGGPKQ